MSTISNVRESLAPVYQMRLIDGTDDQTIWVEVSNEEFNTPLKNPDEWQKRILYPNPPASAVSANAAIAIRACLDEFPESVHDIVEECAAIAENAWRASILQSAMQTCDKCGLTGIHACMGSMETDTTSQQFESLASKAVGGSEGFECTPVADLYELLTKCGECYDYTTSAKVAADWIKEGYSAREYVKLDRLQEALIFASPEPCK